MVHSTVARYFPPYLAPMSLDDEKFMRQAIAMGREGMQRGEGGPFGCVIVKDGQVVGQGNNRVVADHDPTAHAELLAVRDACAHLGTHKLTGCTLYTSCEPCPMCLGAIYWAEPDRIVMAATGEDAKAAGLDASFVYRELALPPEQRRHRLEPLLREEGQALFAEWRAKEDKVRY